MRAQKRPVVIDYWPIDYVTELLGKCIAAQRANNAFRFFETLESADACLIDGFSNHKLDPAAHGNLWISTMEGSVTVGPATHYLMRGVAGEFYACEKAIFDQTYDVLQEVV
jgi:hypothetical protein